MDADARAPHTTTPVEEVGAREIQAARRPLVGVAALCWAVGVLVPALVAARDQSEATRLALSCMFALFLAFVGLSYFQHPGTSARRWMWRFAWLALALWCGGWITVFVLNAAGIAAP